MTNQLEEIITEYEQSLDDAVNYYRKIMELLRAADNNYTLDATTRLTLANINFRNLIDQSGIP